MNGVAVTVEISIMHDNARKTLFLILYNARKFEKKVLKFSYSDVSLTQLQNGKCVKCILE